MQLWALGRAADPEALKTDLPGGEVVSASDIAFEGGPTPRALTEIEIQDYVAAYAKGAKRFIDEAGGDAVEIHGANGCVLLSSFLLLSVANPFL
jgi:NADPH2 dehydrogenase